MRENYQEGLKYFLTFHPPKTMRFMLAQAGFTEENGQPHENFGVLQDVWVAVNGA